jgi:type IV pilus assembly protein PilQ
MFAKRLFGILMLLALTSNAALSAAASAKANASEGQAFTLVSLKHETTGALTRIMIESSAPPLYTVYRPSERMVVVDLPGSDSSQLAPQYAVKNALVDLIAVHQTKGVAGRSLTRIEIATRDDVRDRSMVNGNTLVLELAADLQARDAKYAPEKPATTSGVYVYPTAVAKREAAPSGAKATPAEAKAAPERAAPKPAALKPATLVRDVRTETADGVVRIVVDANGAVQFKDFVLPDPWRVVIDITGVRSSLNNKTTSVGAASVERMRVGQPSPNTVRIVLDAKSKVNYRVERDGESLIITVGDASSSRREPVTPEVKAQKPTDVKVVAPTNVVANQPTAAPKENPPADVVAQKSVKEVITTSTPAANPASASEKSHVKTSAQPEVKVAGQRIENKTESGIPANLLAQSNRPPQVTPQPNRALPLPKPPANNSANAGKETIVNTGSQPAYTRSVLDAPRSQQPSVVNPNARPQSKTRTEMAFCDSSYVGGFISLDLRSGVDLRDMLRFISQQYGVNFILDRSVGVVPVDIRVTDIPWNQVMESVLRANRLGAVCESNGRMIRIATLAAVKEEEDLTAALAKQQAEKIPLATKIIHLKYARAQGALGAGGGGRSGGSGGASGGAASSTGGSLMSIITTRLTPRGRIEMDTRTNSLIITDLPEVMPVIEDMIARLDRPEPQVEIEARIVIASRNFLRDLGVELAGAVIGSKGKAGIFETSPVQYSGGGLAQGGAGSSGGSSGGSGSGGSSGSNGSSGTTSGLGPNLIGPFADTAMRAGVPNTVLGLTTGVLGTSIISSTLSAQETKGQIRTIASPRITTTDGKTAEIVNGVQIPVQTVSNNTVTTTFVTAALRMEITPQIVEETGEVQIHIVAENNTVNFALAGQFNNGTPGINTQSAESTVLIQDGGTTVLGGINVDTEGHTINRTPGVSRIPLLGELFKRRTTRRDTDEILFFITPRIVHNDGRVGPRAPQRSSLEGTPNPSGTQRAAVQPATPKAPVAVAPVNKGGQ